MDDRFTLYGSFTSSSSYKPMLYLALARIPHSFRTVNLKTGVNNLPDYLAVNPMGKVPAIRHDGVLVSEQGAVYTYLADLYPEAGITPAIGAIAGSRSCSRT